MQTFSQMIAEVNASASRRAPSKPAADFTQSRLEEITGAAIVAALRSTKPAPLASAPHDPTIRPAPAADAGTPVDISTFSSVQLIELGLNNSNPAFHPRNPDGTPAKKSKPRTIDLRGVTDEQIVGWVQKNSRASHG